jgi:hypothetical protein
MKHDATRFYVANDRKLLVTIIAKHRLYMLLLGSLTCKM